MYQIPPPVFSVFVAVEFASIQVSYQSALSLTLAGDSQAAESPIRSHPARRVAAWGHGMASALEITRQDHTAAELRSIAGKCNDAAWVRRLLALALVLDGRSRTEAARQNGMDRQTLRD